jgi:asparagine synthase (glutamine-hydrolysing)
VCGIAGFVQCGLVADEALACVRGMTAAIAHRGPDGDGHWVDGPIALGHRRLSIVDLSPTGTQPMHSASGRYVIAFNGEIYNFERLRPELSAAGVRFRGTSDTEVLLAAIERWSLDGALERAIGMFAFALWDRHARTLTLARDRMGEKPLYYGWQGPVFLFGSELKALRAHPAFEDQLDPNALAQLLRWAYVPAPACIHAGLHKLRAGELAELVLPADGAAPTPSSCTLTRRRYWCVEAEVRAGHAASEHGDVDAAADALHDLLRDAVGLQMRADVPVGAFLSGGIDSSLVVALMREHTAHPIRTFSIGFEDRAFDESGDARRVAEHLQTAHTELRVSSAQAREIVPRLPAMFDEPLADASQIPTFLVARLARQAVTVSLSGDGGDELFGGYTKYARNARLAGLPARRLLGQALASPPASFAAALAAQVPGLKSRLTRHRVRRLAHLLAAEDLEVALSDHCPDVAQLLPAVPGVPLLSEGLGLPTLMPAERAAAIDMATYLPDDVLTKVDRTSMCVSLESRAPLLDHRVVRFALQLPWALRGGAGNEKRVLRHLLYRLVPRALVDRPKMGFSVPLAAWLQAELRPWAEALIHDNAAHRDGLFDRAALLRLWNDQCSRTADRSVLLWSVLMFLAWRVQPAQEPA